MSPGAKSNKTNKTTKTQKTEAQTNAHTERDSDNRMTYTQMIANLFTEEFNKTKKVRDNGVSYQQVWKSMNIKWNTTKKEVCLRRLKQMAAKHDPKLGKLSKLGHKYKFEAN